MAQTARASQNSHRVPARRSRACGCALGEASAMVKRSLSSPKRCDRCAGAGTPVATKRSFSVLLWCAIALAAILLVCAKPSFAYASSYEMPKVDISAQAETDGSLHVVEQRTFDFNGDFTAVWWTFSNLPSNAEVVINSVRMVSVDENGEAMGYPQVLHSVPFVLSWRDEGGPGRDAYSFDKPCNTVYVFFDASNEQRLIELDYTVINGVTAYSDVGEVYWQFASSQWEADSDNVTMTLSLPVPSGVSIEPGDTVRAWGHGPADGSVQINEDGSVVYTVPKVKSGNFAEARVVFPSEWLTNLPTGDVQPYRTEERLSSVLSEEQAWADQANRSRVMSLAFVVVCALLCAAALCVGLWVYLRHGKEYEPAFKDTYWRTVPDAQTHPALIGRLWRWNQASADDFTATLMRLVCLGALRIDKGAHPGVEPGKQVDDYLLTRLPDAEQKATHPLDAKAMSILFDKIAKGSDTVWFDQVANYGGQSPRSFVDAIQSWQELLSAEVEKSAYFEADSKKWQKRVIALAVAVAFIAAAAWMSTNDFIPLVFGIPTTIGLVFLGNYTVRRTREGNELCAKCKALRNWLRDFSDLGERPSADVYVWGELMVYAYLFGVADNVMKQLQGAESAVAEFSAAGTTRASWWLWFAAGTGVAGGVLLPAGDLFQQSLVHTENTARAALSAASGKGFSSGRGAGGGFSSGGGGGFSAGGGAR